jgi:hypothetical protein
MTTSLLGPGGANTATVSFASNTRTVWVEWSADAADTAETALELRAQPANPAVPAPPPDRVKVKATETLVVLISGHTQNGANDDDPQTAPERPSKGSGMRKLESALRNPKVGFTNVRLWSEDPGNKGKGAAITTTWCGGGRPEEGVLGTHAKVIYNDIVLFIQDANAHNRVPNIALIGYSHGGGLVHLISMALFDRWQDDIEFDYNLTFTAYIDAIKHPNEWVPFGDDGLLTPETTLPVRTGYHVNYFQSNDRDNGIEEPNGAQTQPAGSLKIHENYDLDWPKESIDHGGDGGIHNANSVLITGAQDNQGQYKYRSILQHIKLAHGMQ